MLSTGLFQRPCRVALWSQTEVVQEAVPTSKNNPPNRPPTSVLLVLKMKFFTKYSLYTQGDSEGPKLRDQAVSDLPAAENDAAIARTTIHYRFVSARAQSHVFPWVSGISRSRELTTRS
jgi:hypothetical protein